MSSMPLHLMVHPEPLAIARLDGGEEPSWDWRAGPFGSLSLTPSETSVVCLAENVPAGVRQEGPFRGVEVAGPLAFDAVGVMTDILSPLVAAGVSVVAFSTFDTDWVLVPDDHVEESREAWRRAGLVVTTTTLSDGGHL